MIYIFLRMRSGINIQSFIHPSIPWSFLPLFILAFIQWMSDWVRWGTSCNGTSKRMTKLSYLTCSWICVWNRKRKSGSQLCKIPFFHGPFSPVHEVDYLLFHFYAHTVYCATNLGKVDLLTFCSSSPRVQGSGSYLCSRRSRLQSNPVYLDGIWAIAVLVDASAELTFIFWFHPQGSTSTWVARRSKHFYLLSTGEWFCKRDFFTSKQTCATQGSDIIDFSRFETDCCKRKHL